MPENGEKRLGHWVLTNTGLLFTMGTALLGGAGGYGVAAGTNAGDHREYTRRLEQCERREAKLETAQAEVLQSLARIEGALGTAPQKGGRR